MKAGRAAAISTSLASLLGAGCTPGALGGGMEPEGTTPDEAPAGPRCRVGDVQNALARFPGASCPWVLIAGDFGAVRLESTDETQPPAFAGVLPEPCGDRNLCRFGGQETTLGPVIVAVQTSPHSEVPAGAYFGVVTGPSTLDFVDLWAGAGPDVMAEGTPVGPAFALAPAACGADLGFLVVRRLPGVEGMSPPDSLQVRAGVYGATENNRWERTGSLPDGCVRFDLSLP